ncbi:MAG: right-handed parallel beta-helix repeat-containing protein, partial [Actinomycetes bacterium]
MARSRSSRLAALSIAGSLSAAMAILPSAPGGAESRNDEGIKVTNCNVAGRGSLADAVAGARSGSTITITASCSSDNPITPAAVIPIDTSLTIKASRSERAVISGGTTHGIFTVAPGAVVSLEGLTLRDGSSTSFAVGEAGGAIHSAGTLNLTNDVFVNNVGIIGAAIATTGPLTVDRCTFGAGFAFLGSSIIASGANVRISNSEISDNRAIIGTLLVLGGSLTLRHSVVTRNVAYGIYGGIVAAVNPQDPVNSLTVSDSTISNNQGGDFGGGLFIGDGMAATIEGSTIANNTAIDGAGIDNSNATLTIRDSVFSGNSAIGA